jgi:predicted ATPase/class 3 adenylate cyclase
VRELPVGTVTFLFSDIEGSTRLLQAVGRDGYGKLQDAHSRIMRSAIAESDGVEIRTEGDSFFVVFPSAVGAVKAAVGAQRALSSHPWGDGPRIRVRIGLHTGEATAGGDDYVGIDVNRAARIAATGHGGQIVLSETTRSLVASELPGGVTVRDLGSHRLKDIEHPERLHDLVIDGLDSEFPPLRTLHTRNTNLPAARTSFVGREDDVAELDALLDDHRLVTVTGPGGTGKTRLALRVAAGRLERHDGVFFVDLSAVREPGLIVPAIAGALKVRDEPSVALEESLLQRLGDTTTLLVLDNFEQLVEGSSVVGTFLDRAPGVTVVATSRVALRLAGEQEYRVDPLSLPDHSAEAPEALMSSEAVTLFVERVAAIRKGFAVTPENAAAIAQIVARLDGLPLALELAATKLRILDVSDLAGRLERRLPMLTGGARDAPERQRTLAETIRWSEESLAADERALFARLSVFSGGFRTAAAEEVCAEGADVLDPLGSLVDASLLRRAESPDGSLRFSMLETIREYALGRFAEAPASERAAIQRRHAIYVRDLAERAEPHLTDEQQLRWFAHLEEEHENVRTALDRAERASDADDLAVGLRTAAAIWRFWQQRGHTAEGRDRLARLLKHAAGRRDAARALALGALGGIDYWLNDYAAMTAEYEEAASIAEELRDRRILAQALFNLSFVPTVGGHPQDATPILERCLEIADLDDARLRGQVLFSIGFLRMIAGDAVGATEPFERAIELLRGANQTFAACESLEALAGVRLAQGDFDGAVRDLSAATELAIGSQNPLLIALSTFAHALLANASGRFERAARLLGAAEGIRRVYDINTPAVGLSFWGDPADESRAALGEEAFELARAEGADLSLPQIADLMEGTLRAAEASPSD